MLDGLDHSLTHCLALASAAHRPRIGILDKMSPAGQSLIELQGPTDTVSSLTFSVNNPVYLLASSWDGHLRLFDISTRSVVRDFTERAPILGATFVSETRVVTGSLDGALRFYDLEQGQLQQEQTIHKDAIRSLVYSTEHRLLVAGSWDRTFSVHSLSSDKIQSVQIELPEKVFSMSSNKDHLVIGMSNRQVYIYTFAQLFEALATQDTTIKPLQRRESSLKFMTRTLKCTLTDDVHMAGYVSTSIEGRVAVEFIDASEQSQTRKYAFKCHRQKGRNEAGEEEDVVYPVNAIEFHPRYKTFASAGGDGVISLWDLKAKKRVKQYASIGSEIQVLAYSPDSKLLAIGTGSLGSKESVTEGKIYLREMAEGEGKGKS